MELGQVLRDYERRFRAEVDKGTANILDLRQRGQAAIDALTAAVARITAVEGRASQLLTRLQNDEAALSTLGSRVTALESRMAAAEAELVKLDPTYVPPTG